MTTMSKDGRNTEEGRRRAPGGMGRCGKSCEKLFFFLLRTVLATFVFVFVFSCFSSPPPNISPSRICAKCLPPQASSVLPWRPRVPRQEQQEEQWWSCGPSPARPTMCFACDGLSPFLERRGEHANEEGGRKEGTEGRGNKGSQSLLLGFVCFISVSSSSPLSYSPLSPFLPLIFFFFLDHPCACAALARVVGPW